MIDSYVFLEKIKRASSLIKEKNTTIFFNNKYHLYIYSYTGKQGMLNLDLDFYDILKCNIIFSTILRRTGTWIDINSPDLLNFLQHISSKGISFKDILYSLDKFLIDGI